MRWTALALLAAIASVGCGPRVAVEEEADATGSSTATTVDVTTGIVTTAGPGTTLGTTVDPVTSEATTLETVSTSTATGDDDEGPSFIDPNPDGGGSVWCHVFSQDCPAGEKCMPWANDGGSQWNAQRCSPLDPNPSTVGEPCVVEGTPVSGIDSCDETSMCFYVDVETNSGTCVAFCSGTWFDPSCANPANACMIANEGVISICLPTCDPLLQDCGALEGCYPAEPDYGFVCAPDNSRAGGVDGDDCNYGWHCDPGLTCVAPALLADCPGLVGNGCCTSYCDLAQPPEAECDTLSGETCIEWIPQGAPPPGLAQLGVCRLPE